MAPGGAVCGSTAVPAWWRLSRLQLYPPTGILAKNSLSREEQRRIQGKTQPDLVRAHLAAATRSVRSGPGASSGTIHNLLRLVMKLWPLRRIVCDISHLDAPPPCACDLSPLRGPFSITPPLEGYPLPILFGGEDGRPAPRRGGWDCRWCANMVVFKLSMQPAYVLADVGASRED